MSEQIFAESSTLIYLDASRILILYRLKSTGLSGQRYGLVLLSSFVFLKFRVPCSRLSVWFSVHVKLFVSYRIVTAHYQTTRVI